MSKGGYMSVTILFWFAIAALVASAFMYAKNEWGRESEAMVAAKDALALAEALDKRTAKSRDELARVDSLAEKLGELELRVGAAEKALLEASGAITTATAKGKERVEKLAQKIEWLAVKIDSSAKRNDAKSLTVFCRCCAAKKSK